MTDDQTPTPLTTLDNLLILFKSLTALARSRCLM